ncbi:phosphatase PAP2 family protein [Ruminococcus flavefaciens]|uniref:phosphatase PAP2 family protein n=1 Tax=Ruminococcus flavefaciens TaxID=1265 RepID=UPI0026EE7927|nr:phosphatase PAP2 family protein [Ruminococcus flavefaciens]MDD7517682.1 phosphatase PAP2 family protein [Ruminococcus flavefaciens]MDY5693019.1 phosphatase PAP2 family protein [Ruminococcus flavefaciens]
MDKYYTRQLRLNILMLVLFGGLFITGTFLDKACAETIFRPDMTITKVITSMGVYPYHAAQVLFLGVLYERTLHCKANKQVKMMLCTFCLVLMLILGFIGGRSLTDRNNLGNIFPTFVGNVPIIIIISSIMLYPLFLLGYFAAKKSDDKLLAERVLWFCAIMLIAYISMQILKNTFDRPRYRTVVLGYDGVTFVPWYTHFPDAEKYTAMYSLNADEFRSFPSGHSIFSNLSMCIFPSLALLFPKLKDKQLQLFCAGFVFALIIMTSRMILGAHYLSDVSAGAVIGVLSSIAFAAIQLKISSKNNIK